MQNDLIKIKISSRGNEYAGNTKFNWFDEKTFAYIHALEIFDITDKYFT